MLQARRTLTLKGTLRAVDAMLRGLFAPGMIAVLLVGFLALTFLAAELVASVLDQSAPIGVLLLWAAATALGTALVRLLPRVLK